MWLLLLLFLAFPPSLQAAPVSYSPKITVRLGGTEARLFGYTSPLSRVDLTSFRVNQFTFSDTDGYFEFSAAQLPDHPFDLCLSSVDADSRPTTPVCIPPPRAAPNTDIGPVILPPTLTLDQEIIKAGSTVIASGQSTPDSVVDIHFFQETNRPPVFPKPARAFSLPKLTVTTDRDGRYSFNLPTAYSTNYRLFAAVQFLDHTSPKSNTLMFKLPSLWYLFWLENRLLVIFLPLFIVTLTFFFYLIHLYLNPIKTAQKYWLTLYPKSLILKP